MPGHGQKSGYATDFNGTNDCWTCLISNFFVFSEVSGLVVEVLLIDSILYCVINNINTKAQIHYIH